MSRHGYSEDWDNDGAVAMWRGVIASVARAAARDTDPRAKSLHRLALAALKERDALVLRIAELEKVRDERHDVMTDLA